MPALREAVATRGSQEKQAAQGAAETKRGFVTKTFWMSFTDPDCPEGQRFLGVVVLDITAADAEAARPLLPPTARPGAEWILAAQREAWRLGCNPGGEVKSWELPSDHPSAAAPRRVLLTRDDLIRLGLID